MIYTGTKQPEQSVEDFRTCSLDRHAPLFMKHAPQGRKYTINFPPLRSGKEPPALGPDFITGIWWEDIEALLAFYRSDDYLNIIKPDGQKLFATGSAIHFDAFVQKADRALG